MKDNRIDLWLDSADLIALSQFANRYKTSYQRIIETALTQAVARRLVNAEVSDYKRVQRIPLRLDQLGREQIKILSAMTDASDQDVLRLALQSLFTNAIDHSLYD